MYPEGLQQVPTLEEIDIQMYDSDFSLPNFILEQEQCMWENTEIKDEPQYDDCLFATRERSFLTDFYSEAAQEQQQQLQSQNQHRPRQRTTSTSSTITSGRLRHWNLPTTSDSEPSTPIGASTLASPVLNMPVMGQLPAYSNSQSFSQTFSPYSSVIVSNSLASPSSPYAPSPASTTYSSSPVNSPQHPNPHGPEDFLRYGLRQALHRHAVATHGNSPYGYYVDYSGRRRKRDDELSPEEYEKRRLRRERNKLAAWRCRTRRRERIEQLEQETAEIEDQNAAVENEISTLKNQLSELQKLLDEHDCHKKSDKSDSSLSIVKVKEESNDS